MRVSVHLSRAISLGLATAGGMATLAACAGISQPYVTSSQPPERTSAAASTPSPSARPLSTPTATIDVSTLKGRIAFSGGPWPDVGVYTVNADGSGLAQVTAGGAADFDPTWSPDGTRIAYRHQTSDDRTTDIYVIDTDGTGARNLTGDDGTADWGPAWSPDGGSIAWNTAAGAAFGFDLGLIRPDGSGRTEIKPGRFVEYPAWSPDGKQIAFMSQVAEEGRQYDVFVMNADGSHVVRLTDTPGEDGWPTWSPDGKTIAFSSNRDDCRLSSAPDCLSTGDLGPYCTLYLMAPDGSDQRRVSALFAQIADWSPDGRYLVFEGRGGLTVVSVDGSATGRIPIAITEPLFPDWIP